MKSKRFFSVVIFLVGITFNSLYAQKALEELITKCEDRDDVKVSVVKGNNRNNVVTISFTNNPSLEKEIIEAFKQEKSNADQVIEEKDKGKVNQLFYKFTKDNTTSTYIYHPAKNSKGENQFTFMEKKK